MKTMKEQCVYIGGPYKSYCGRAEYDSEAGIFHGEVIGTQDVVTFQGKTLDEVGQAFRESVEDYLVFCDELGQLPEKPFSGRFVARIPPQIHKQITAMAQASGKSLNQFICDALEAMVRAGGQPPAPTIPVVSATRAGKSLTTSRKGNTASKHRKREFT